MPPSSTTEVLLQAQVISGSVDLEVTAVMGRVATRMLARRRGRPQRDTSPPATLGSWIPMWPQGRNSGLRSRGSGCQWPGSKSRLLSSGRDGNAR
jgi:hypothetical protein